ncbi:MAG: acyl-CoA thioesterase [Bacteroidetes bacterium]|nr:acyl-CoA thioesterase [Bacteroidota bacterium]
MYESTTQTRVRYAETDQMNVVYYGNYAQYFEIGRVESMRALGFTYKRMEDEGVIMPVVEMHIRYLRPATYDDLLTIKTQVRSLPVSYHIEFFQEVFNEENKLLAAGRVVLYFLKKDNWKRIDIPADLSNTLAKYF